MQISRGRSSYQQPAEYERYEQLVVDEKGSLKVVPLRRGKADSAFIDTISFTFHESSVAKFNLLTTEFFPIKGVSDRDVLARFSSILEWIFGFGISSHQPVGKGRFYESRWQMERDGVLYGQVYIGGQEETILVEMTGKGCAVAEEGWEERLHRFLDADTTYRAKITRCDVAKDFFNHEISPDTAWEMYEQGKFDKRGKRPLVGKLGDDWLNPTEKGKTLTIGSKHSSVFCRIYDKAKEQGDTSGLFWCRFEQQYMGRNCFLGLDILLCPGAYWGGAFEICASLQQKGVLEHRQVSNAKRAEISVERSKEVAAKQVGRTINMMIYLGMKDEEIVDYLRRKDGTLPHRVNPAAYFVSEKRACEYLHDYEADIDVVNFDEYGMILTTLQEKECKDEDDCNCSRYEKKSRHDRTR